MAAKYNVIMAIECHAPTSIDDPCHEPYLEAVEHTGLPFLAFQADLSSFQLIDSIPSAENAIRNNGGTREVIYYLRGLSTKKAAGEEIDKAEIEEKLKKMGANDVDMQYFSCSHSPRNRAIKPTGAISFAMI